MQKRGDLGRGGWREATGGAGLEEPAPGGLWGRGLRHSQAGEGRPDLPLWLNFHSSRERDRR